MGSHNSGFGNKKMLQCVANVPHLSIHGQNVMFHLPSDAAWQSASFVAGNKLALQFEDSRKFVRTVPRFTATYGSLCNPWMADLCAALAAQGISWATQQETKGKSNSGILPGTSLPAAGVELVWIALLHRDMPLLRDLCHLQRRVDHFMANLFDL